MTENSKIQLTFNGKEVTAPAGVSVLRAAEINDVYIPTLCYHKDLSIYGGCRVCIVEIDGMRGYPLSCSTIAEDGMVVTTDNVAIKEIRTELVQLLMSEHPSSCLICAEAVECRTFMKTVRKAGVTSGCRYCSNDDQCEFQDVVEHLEIKKVNYPVIYRGHESERVDPFFDRDYNICILCGRCIRMCQEMRGTGVLAFNYRGPKARVGTAFGRDHIEAGCEFCGACISVCPTGTLADKVSKWDGIPDGHLIGTCPYCAIGCQLEMWHKDGSFSKALPANDPEVNDGQACLKGRFCMSEVSHHFDRARKPFALVDNYWKEQTWDEAIEKASNALKDLKPGEFSMLISPDLTNESLYTAQKFTRLAMKTNSIDSTARLDLGGGLPFWAGLFQNQITIQSIKKSSKILGIGLDTRFNFSIVGVEMRKARNNGAEFVSINSRISNVAKYAHSWIRPESAMEGKVLTELINALDGKKVSKTSLNKLLQDDGTSFDEAVNLLKDYKDLTVIFGPRIFKYSDTSDLTKALLELSNRKNVRVIPLYYGTNTRGAMDLGTFPELFPGPVSKNDKKGIKKIESSWKTTLPTDDGLTIDQIISGEKKPKVLYLVGAVPFFERPDCDFIISQDIFKPDFEVDLYLPAASFLETSGTLVNMEGRVQESVRVEELPDSVMFGRARPDWWIFSEIAKKLGANGFKYKSSEEILDEISVIADGFPKSGMITRELDTFTKTAKIPVPSPVSNSIKKKGKFLLIMQPGGYTYRGIDIRTKVEGLQILNPEMGFFINTNDAESLDIKPGDEIIVKANGVTGKAPVQTGAEIPPGTIYLYVPQSYGGLKECGDLKHLYNLKVNPCTAEVKKVGV